MSDLPLGARIADGVADLVGSWKFIVFQSIALCLWIVLNSTVLKWDIYPFILLNLGLSFQAAYTAPFILMSQGRQTARDRRTLEQDLQTNMRELNLMQQIEAEINEIKALIETVNSPR